jgi:ATP-binding cassette subfamily B protein
LVEAGPFLDDLDGFLADAPPPPPPGRARELRHELELQDVRFCYPGRARPAVDGVTLRVPRGTIVALVGENGSGKTTLAKIAAGLLDPQHGGVSWDADRAVPGEDLRASVSVIFQDFVAYDMTPLDNIAISDTSSPPDRARAERSAERTGLTAVIADLPSGWETVLGLQLAEGSDLSGGQWQRLALARALYRDSPLLIMDEPSASLDPRAEHELFADVRAVLDGRSALLISHRYSSVRLADYIYVLAEGRVVEEGTHEQLVRADGRYAELYALQASTYLGA